MASPRTPSRVGIRWWSCMNPWHLCAAARWLRRRGSGAFERDDIADPCRAVAARGSGARERSSKGLAPHRGIAGTQDAIRYHAVDALGIGVRAVVLTIGAEHDFVSPSAGAVADDQAARDGRGTVGGGEGPRDDAGGV